MRERRKIKGYDVPKSPYKIIRVGAKTMREHRYVMEKHLGRSLTQMEQVHHINGDTLDNRVENLQIVTAWEHHQIHRAIRNASHH